MLELLGGPSLQLICNLGDVPAHKIEPVAVVGRIPMLGLLVLDPLFNTRKLGCEITRGKKMVG